jgi:hypothetical protein
VVVRNFADDGISVTGTGALAIREGVSSKNNGTAANNANGLTVGTLDGTDTASVVITTSASSDTVAFNENTGYGIAVYGSGSVTIAGVASGSGANGTVTANNNGFVGLVIDQTPGTEVPQNAITGLVAWGNGTDTTLNVNYPQSGIVIGGGSSVILRDSYVLKNSGNGVTVRAHIVFSGGGSFNFDTGKIDLGKTYNTNPGRNTLQAAGGNNPNTGAGICLRFYTNSSPETLEASGNIFGSTNCSTGTGALTKNANCNSGVDVSVITNTSATNTIVVNNCTM